MLRGVVRDAESSHRIRMSVYACLAIGTCAAFAGVARNGFVRFDDDVIILENRMVRGGLTWEGVQLALTRPSVDGWHPLTTLSHMVDCQIFGISRPGGHHLVSLVLHMASVLILFEALRRMTGQIWPSAFVAALFAIHPLRVESVAWAAERKDVLSGLFFMLTLLAYASYVKQPSLGKYALVSLALILGLSSKSMLVTLPCVLLLLDFWPLGRWRTAKSPMTPEGPHDATSPRHTAARLVLEKVPWLIAAAISCWATLAAEDDAKSSLGTLPVEWRLAIASVGSVTYLWKTIWPSGLAVLYPHPGFPPSAEIGRWIAPTLGAGLLLLSLSVCAIGSTRRRPYLFVGWFWYLGMLLPVSGLIQVGPQAYADRYTYLPMIGVYIAISWLAVELVQRWPAARSLLVALAIAWLACLIAATWHQVGKWRNTETLLVHTLQVTKENPLIENNLGYDYLEHGQLTVAATHFQRALEIMPRYVRAHNNLGWVFMQQGDLARAAHEFNQAKEVDQSDSRTCNNLGQLFQRQGDLRQAALYFRLAIQAKPQEAAAYDNLGCVFQLEGEPAAAAEQFRRAIRLEPDYAPAHGNLGWLLLQQGDPAGAAAELQLAIQLAPRFALAHNNLGWLYLQQGDLAKAAEQFRLAIEFDPKDTRAYINLGRVFLRQGDLPGAEEQFRLASSVRPNEAAAYDNLGCVLLQQGELVQAAAQFHQAIRLDPDYAEAHNNLGMVLLRQDKLREARAEFERALALKRNYPDAQSNLSQVRIRIEAVNHQSP